MLGKTNLTGRLGYRFGIGSTPKKRVVTFYEKHAPEKIHEVDSIVSKYYGDYKTLTKKLERKYQDYGYFVGWEQVRRSEGLERSDSKSKSGLPPTTYHLPPTAYPHN